MNPKKENRFGVVTCFKGDEGVERFGARVGETEALREPMFSVASGEDGRMIPMLTGSDFP